MDEKKEAIARTCLKRAESNTASSSHMTKMLIEAGFEGYITDLRRGVVTYYLPSRLAEKDLDFALGFAKDVGITLKGTETIRQIIRARFRSR